MSSALVTRTNRWFTRNARPLPWRAAEATAWHVVMSEFMLQQTPVARVLPVYERWVRMFPTPSALAAVPASEAVREWGRLGYPRRAQRLHALSVILDRDFDDQVPADEQVLRGLPGIGEYTAAAVAAFAFGKRSVVVDTNVRRVIARAVQGQQWPAQNLSRAEYELASSLVPKSSTSAALWAASSMELGATICTASSPRCDECPLMELCSWNLSGRPQSPRPHRTQSWHGTDRQCRGVILQALRESNSPVPNADLRALWTDDEQFKRCLLALREEDFVVRTQKGWTLK